MPGVSVADRADCRGMSRRREPVPDDRTDPTPFEGRIALSFVAGNEEDQPLAPLNRLGKAPIDCVPSRVEAVAVEVDDSVRFGAATAQTAIPATI